jgi:hypothetical protein
MAFNCQDKNSPKSFLTIESKQNLGKLIGAVVATK